jgi:hypothetical protein
VLAGCASSSAVIAGRGFVAGEKVGMALGASDDLDESGFLVLCDSVWETCGIRFRMGETMVAE